MPERENVLSRIYIAVADDTLPTLRPFSYSKFCDTFRSTTEQMSPAVVTVICRAATQRKMRSASKPNSLQWPHLACTQQPVLPDNLLAVAH